MTSKVKEHGETLCKEETRELFEEEAILIGSTDAVPVYRVAELFGSKAAEFSLQVMKEGVNGFGIGDYTLMYFNYKGFQIAATYYNIAQIKERGISQ